MMRRYRVVDVFAERPFSGNPVAVVLDGEGLSTDQMQTFANWTNLSETTFVLPAESPGGDYRVRIFTPVAELPFAGHPTLGTCHAWREAHPEAPTRPVVQECAAGQIAVRPSAHGLAFAAPPLVREGPAEEDLIEHVARSLAIDRKQVEAAEWVDNGPGWLAVYLDSAEAVLAIVPTAVDMDIGVVGPYPAGSREAFEVRAFFVADGKTIEDPVTGSLNAGLAPWLLRTGRARAPYIVSQGRALGREGRVHVDRDTDATIWVGGATRTCVSGQVELGDAGSVG
jgi:PhzF family phenazine biosynthesis protein